MTQTDAAAIERFLHQALFYCLQPVLLVIVISCWYLDPTREETYLLVIIFVQLVLGFAEQYFSARPAWLISTKEKIRNVALVVVLTMSALAVTELYQAWLSSPLDAVRVSIGLDIWPQDWPLLVQLFMVFFLSELLWYWMHRAEHRWNLVWRLSGHGSHHSFKKLGALNFGLNHPVEYFFIVLPSFLVELTFGVGTAALGAAILTVTQTSIAHANIVSNTRLIGLLFTTGKYHICHHSAVLKESNTNYGCSAIIWDRLFGTFLDKTIDEAGTGPTEPTLWEKFLMPFKEPGDTTIAPGTSEVGI
ncbi:MAG: sterol desaturase family protein [Pseudomonadales bacterium]|nr:sterol desaturase family protein [Pseudomonadales bacterium]